MPSDGPNPSDGKQRPAAVIARVVDSSSSLHRRAYAFRVHGDRRHQADHTPREVVHGPLEHPRRGFDSASFGLESPPGGYIADVAVLVDS